jgi:hypothetical protein
VRGLEAYSGTKVGFDYGSILAPLFQAGGGAIDMAQQSQKEGDAAAAVTDKLTACINADNAATSAVAQLTIAQAVAKVDKTKSAAVKTAKAAASQALAAQDKAGAALPEEKRPDRVAAAQAGVTAAQAKVGAASGQMKVVAQAQLDAAKQTLAKAQGVDAKGAGKSDDSSGFFSKSVVGPVKVWHAAVMLVVGGLGVVAWRKAK